MFPCRRFTAPARTKTRLPSCTKNKTTIQTIGGNMGEVTNEQVNLMLRLYEERREPKLREARDWFSANFHVKIAEDLTRVCPPGSKENTYMRMACHVQQPKLPRHPGKTMQPPGSVAREAQPRVQ